MESNDLKSPPPPDDAHLEAWLRAHASRPALPDDGFSQRVLHALPAPVRQPAWSSRRIAIAAGAVAGLGTAVFGFLTGTVTGIPLPAAQPDWTQLLTQLADPKLHTALGVTLVTLGFAFRRQLRRWAPF